MTGTIKKKTDRGFGFISIQGEDKDLFFHSSALVGVAFDSLQEGAEVTFEVENGADGRQKAVNVTLSEQGSQSAATQEQSPVEESAPAEEAVANEVVEATETAAEEPATENEQA